MERAACEFVRASGREVPSAPRAFSKTEAEFLARMMLSEILEFLQATHGPDEARVVLEQEMDELPCLMLDPDQTELAKQAEQADALVDCIYYALDGAAQHGMNLGMSGVFGLVHRANMAKRDPATGLFKRRPEDGKVVKPPGWTPPDIQAEMQRQKRNGSFPWRTELQLSVKEIKISVLAMIASQVNYAFFGPLLDMTFVQLGMNIVVICVQVGLLLLILRLM